MQSHRKRGASAPAGLLGTLGAPPSRRGFCTRSATAGSPWQQLLERMPADAVAVIWRLLPADALWACRATCSAFRAACASSGAWQHLHFAAHEPGVARPLIDHLLRSAARMAQGELRALDVRGQLVSTSALNAVIDEHAASLQELFFVVPDADARAAKKAADTVQAAKAAAVTQAKKVAAKQAAAAAKRAADAQAAAKKAAVAGKPAADAKTAAARKTALVADTKVAASQRADAKKQPMAAQVQVRAGSART
jgi:hypothetical protein